MQIAQGQRGTGGLGLVRDHGEVYVWPLDSVAVGKQAIVGPTTKADQDRQDDALAGWGCMGTPATFYNIVAVPADPTAPGATPFDVSTTIDQALWIALLGKPTTDLSQLAGRTLFVGVGFDEAIPESFNLEHIGTNGATAYAAANLTRPRRPWRGGSGTGRPAPAKRGRSLATLDVLGDTTGGMVPTGVVKLQMPKVMPVIDPTQPLDGGASSPPPLTDQQLAARVVGWLRVGRPQEETDEIHRVTWVGLNAVGADQALTATAAELLGTGNGRLRPAVHPHQAASAAGHGPAPGGRAWTAGRTGPRSTRFATGGPDDLQFSVDYTSGVIQFGSGRVPQIGEQIRVLTYRYGGGAAGNVAAKSVTGITSSTGSVSVQAANPLSRPPAVPSPPPSPTR